MPVSVARLTANKANAQRSTGPKTVEGKALSRQNSWKHGLSGQGVVLPENDSDEVRRRTEALRAELAPQSVLGAILVTQLAALSVKMERGTTQESANLASRVRQAPEAFDDERFEAVEALFLKLGDDPRGNLRQLKKSPEGVQRLAEAWGELRSGLSRETKPIWSPLELQKVANLMGLLADGLKGSRLDALTMATWGYFGELPENERVGLEVEARKAWARKLLIQRIDEEIAGLKALYQTFNFAGIAQDRAEAGDRALFDPSREATLARRYESEARRGFFKALNEFRQVEAEVPAIEKPVETAPALGSFRERGGLPVREPEPGSGAVPKVATRAPKGSEMGRNGVESRGSAVGRAALPVS